jgi:outer membrane lipoprotein SlyB
MTTIRYVRSIATASWIDPVTGLPEVDETPPGNSVTRQFLTGPEGFRFCNFLEVWATYDSVTNAFTGHGFTDASGIYTAPSFAGISSHRFPMRRGSVVATGDLVFTQLVGARTHSAEIIGGGAGVLGGAAAGAVLGSVVPFFGTAVGAGVGAVVGLIAGPSIARAVTHFPPIWSELELRIRPDGSTSSRVIRHSLFPSMSFYSRPVRAPLTPLETGAYSSTPPSGTYYNGVPNYETWLTAGWGTLGGSGSGATRGNPWGMNTYDL